MVERDNPRAFVTALRFGGWHPIRHSAGIPSSKQPGSGSGRPGHRGGCRGSTGAGALFIRSAATLDPLRIRNIGADVAVGDWVVPSSDGERVEHVVDRHSAFVRRASFEGARFEAQTIAANIDVVFLVHALDTPSNQRRLERELVLAFDSGAEPVVVLTKTDLVDDPAAARGELVEVALGVPVLLDQRSHRGRARRDRRVRHGQPHARLPRRQRSRQVDDDQLLLGGDVQATSAVREGDSRGRHTTVAAQLLRLPGEGWLIDTPGVRAVSLWLSGRGIERAFADVFDLMDHCRFRDCKHDQEPGCAVLAAIDAGTLDPARFASLERLVAEEAALEEEQRRQEKLQDRRGYRKR